MSTVPFTHTHNVTRRSQSFLNFRMWLAELQCMSINVVYSQHNLMKNTICRVNCVTKKLGFKKLDEHATIRETRPDRCTVSIASLSRSPTVTNRSCIVVSLFRMQLYCCLRCEPLNCFTSVDDYRVLFIFAQGRRITCRLSRSIDAVIFKHEWQFSKKWTDETATSDVMTFTDKSS